MSTRTLLPKPRKQASRLRPVSLREQTGSITPVFTSPLTVDEEAGVIQRVKILGWESKNGRRYVPEAVKKKLHLYDGAKAFVDHPAKATDPRACEAALGVWRNPVVEADGAYADLHYFKSHPLAARVVEDAKRGLGVFGASHNADGQGEEDRAGVFVVQEITEVRSVDLVTDAATVTNLWESRQMPQLTLRALIEGNADRKKLFATHLLEMPEDMADMPLDMPAEPAPAETGDWKADLVAAIGKLVSSEDEADHKMAQKIMGMLKPGAAAPAETVATEGEAESDEDKKKKEEDKAKTEGRKAASIPPGTITLTEEKAKDLCDLASMAPDTELLESIVGLDEARALTILRQFKKRSATKSSGVRSQGPGSFDTAPNDESLYRSAVQRLTGREPATRN